MFDHCFLSFMYIIISLHLFLDLADVHPFSYDLLDEGNLIFCCAGLTNPNFLANQNNNTDFTFYLCVFHLHVMQKALQLHVLFFCSTFSLWFQRQANNFFANISSFTTQEACNEDQTYLFDMPSTFMSCTLKINNLTKSMLNHDRQPPKTYPHYCNVYDHQTWLVVNLL